MESRFEIEKKRGVLKFSVYFFGVNVVDVEVK